MRNLFIVIFVILSTGFLKQELLAGYLDRQSIHVEYVEPNIGDDHTIGVGDTFFKISIYEGPGEISKSFGGILLYEGGKAIRFEMVVTELDKQKIVLDYTEYERLPSSMALRHNEGWYSIGARNDSINNPEEFEKEYGKFILPIIYEDDRSTPWVVKSAFNKKYTYNIDLINNRIIRFKDYEFEVLNIETGRMKYRRLK